MQEINRRMQPPMPLDTDRIKASGIARVDSQHLRLFTDVRDAEVVRELLTVFDAAVPQWCERFEIDPKRAVDWQLTAVLVQGPDTLQRFRKAGLIPDDLPEFAAGFNRGHEIWLFLQPGEYHTRHLLLHEGTHAFMQWFLDGSGPPWFSEGMAELMAVHSWDKEGLRLGLKNATREGTPYWGRPKIVRQDVKNGLPRSLKEVMETPPEAFRDVDNYGWAWAACRFLDHHPRTQEKFRSMARLSRDTSERFNYTLTRKISSDLIQLEREWSLYQKEMDYSYSVERAVVVPAIKQGADWIVRADRGWQSTAVQVEKGDTIVIRASGRFQIKKTDQPWISEANGVTIEYFQGQPLGILEASVLPKSKKATGFWEGTAIGTGREFVPQRSGELILRINDSPSQRDDNEGQLTVSIKNNR